MRLINAHTLTLEEFWDETKKKYAILSHRWDDVEISFADMQKLAVASTTKGFAKIQNACERAVNDGYDYVWVDTCCINKESSAELTEAINSMYRWYQASAVCYAFLSDVNIKTFDTGTVEQQIKPSVWFKRGWTLQELVASQHIVFYDQNWEFLGTKQTLSKLLTLWTGIDEAILNGEALSSRSIAQRMSWASQRVTTREEDTAYCLLGIFDVNMPMLYGEGGERAFLRLQEEIIKRSDDHTIFAWPINRDKQPGLLADSPKAFENCQHIRTLTSRKGRSPYSLTNRGLSIKLTATQFTTDTYLVRLECSDGLMPSDGSSADGFRLGMFLRRLDEDDQYARVKHDGKTFLQVEASTWDPEALKLRRSTRPVQQIEINVRQQFTEFNTTFYRDRQQVTEFNTKTYRDRVNGFRIATPELLERSSKGKDLFKVSASSWNPQEHIMSMKQGDFGTVGSLDISQQDRKIKIIKLGFDFEYNPVCFIATASGINEKSQMMDRNGKINFNTAAKEAQWTKEELAQFPGINQRNPFDTLAWNKVYNGAAIELSQHSGLWALKGDRIDGLNVRVGELGTLWIVRGMFQDKLVWDVYLDNMKDGAFRKIFK